MVTSSGDERVFKQTRWSSARRQEDAVLLYNAHTDELHLIPHDAFYVFQLCDGIHTVGEIADMVGEGTKAEPAEVREHLTVFLNGLVDRGVLETCSSHGLVGDQRVQRSLRTLFLSFGTAASKRIDHQRSV
jgi:Coenzyme PQQ synthesis protein D (PqqD)